MPENLADHVNILYPGSRNYNLAMIRPSLCIGKRCMTSVYEFKLGLWDFERDVLAN